MDTLTVARSWVRNGFSVIPLGWRSKRPAFGALRLTGMVNEAGTTWDPLKQRQPTDEELRLWFTGPRRNLGIVTGWKGLTVLDFDQRDIYRAWMSWAAAEGGRAAHIAANTYRVFSARGVHVYVMVNEPVESFRVAEVDIKAKWGYVLAPPSVHPNGHEYHSEGNTIMRCARLSEVFPFERPPSPRIEALPVVATNDPWEAASRAVVCGGESVATAKRQLEWNNLVQVVHQDRAGTWARCPLHDDWNPSLRLYADGHAHCFQCGFHGDTIDMYATLHQITTREAIAALSA